MLGLPQCQRCGTEVDYDNHNRNGYNGKNGYNSAIMASMTKMIFCQRVMGVAIILPVFQHLLRLLNEHCVGSLDRISKFLGSSSTRIASPPHTWAQGFALPVWPVRVCVRPATDFGFMNNTTLCTKNSTLRVYMKKFTLY